MTITLRLLAFLWASPVTLLGLPLAGLAAATGGGARVVEGVLEAQGGAIAWLLRHATTLPGGAAAMTLGHVVIARTPTDLVRTRAHERVHVRQCERWGPLFLPAYAVGSLIAWRRTGRAYRDNFLEREAYAVSHGAGELDLPRGGGG